MLFLNQYTFSVRPSHLQKEWERDQSQRKDYTVSIHPELHVLPANGTWTPVETEQKGLSKCLYEGE